MPTVLRLDGLEFFIYTNDHQPAHVHVFRGREEAKIAIGDDRVAPYVLDPGVMPGRDVRMAVHIVAEHQAVLLGVWRKLHA